MQLVWNRKGSSSNCDYTAGVQRLVKEEEHKKPTEIEMTLNVTLSQPCVRLMIAGKLVMPRRLHRVSLQEDFTCQSIMGDVV